METSYRFKRNRDFNVIKILIKHTKNGMKWRYLTVSELITYGLDSVDYRYVIKCSNNIHYIGVNKNDNGYIIDLFHIDSDGTIYIFDDIYIMEELYANIDYGMIDEECKKAINEKGDN